MFITKKALEEKISRAICEAREKEQERVYLNERFRDMQSLFDERWRYMDQRISTLENKAMKEALHPCDETVNLAAR